MTANDYLLEQEAADRVGWSVRYFRKFGIPFIDNPRHPIKAQRKFRKADLDAWRADHPTSLQAAAIRARERHTNWTTAWRDAAGNLRPITQSPHYERWRNIMRRCYDGSHSRWDDYGGRGIGVYGPWREDPLAFHNWLEENLEPCPKGWTLDRIDNDGNYEPGNLRWADARTQNRNRRVSLPESSEELKEIEGCVWCHDGLHERDVLGRPMCPLDWMLVVR